MKCQIDNIFTANYQLELGATAIYKKAITDL